MPFEGCQILQFDDSSGDAEKAAFKSCIDYADDKIQIAGNQVAVFKEKLEAIASGVVEISAKTGKDDGWEMFIFVLMGYLGHGVYL